MIVTEVFEIKGIPFNRVYSDAGRYVMRDGIEYEEACDAVSDNRVYTEGGLIPPPEVDESEQADKAEAYDILMGVSE